MLIIYIVMIYFTIIMNYKFAIMFCYRKPFFMLLLGSIDIIIAVLLNSTIRTLAKINLPIFKELVVANYMVNISIAAIGANIIASAIIIGAEHAAKNKENEKIKELRFLEEQLAFYKSIKEINKIVDTQEKILDIKKSLGID